MINYLFILIFSFVMFSFGNAFAYLDPGTGSIIIQAILGFIAAAVTTLSIYWSKFKIFLKKIFEKRKNKQ